MSAKSGCSLRSVPPRKALRLCSILLTHMLPPPLTFLQSLLLLLVPLCYSIVQPANGPAHARACAVSSAPPSQFLNKKPLYVARGDLFAFEVKTSAGPKEPTSVQVGACTPPRRTPAAEGYPADRRSLGGPWPGRSLACLPSLPFGVARQARPQLLGLHTLPPLWRGTTCAHAHRCAQFCLSSWNVWLIGMERLCIEGNGLS